jgi:hypothetical protein
MLPVLFGHEKSEERVVLFLPKQPLLTDHDQDKELFLQEEKEIFTFYLCEEHPYIDTIPSAIDRQKPASPTIRYGFN